MRQTFFTQKIKELGRCIVQLLHRRVLAVQNAQRIAVQPPFGVFVELVGMLLKVSNQRGTVLKTLRGLTQAVASFTAYAARFGLFGE